MGFVPFRLTVALGGGLLPVDFLPVSYPFDVAMATFSARVLLCPNVILPIELSSVGYIEGRHVERASRAVDLNAIHRASESDSSST